MTLEELRNRLAEIESRMEEIAGEDFTMSEEETREYDELSDEHKEVRKKIERMIALGDVKNYNSQSQNEPNRPSPEGEGEDESTGEDEFRNLGDFIKEMRFKPNSKRMQAYQERANDMLMSDGNQLGIMVPQQFGSKIFKFDPESAIIRPRANVIPAGSPPDSSITFPALKQGSNGAYAGVEVVWTAETEEMSQTDTELQDLTLEPNEVSAYVVVSDKLLRNADAASQFLENLLRGAVINAEEYKFIQGSGAGCPKGIINSDGIIIVSRNTSASVLYEDIIGMEAVMLPNSNNLLWIASQSIYEDIKDMQDSSNARIYTGPNLVKGVPATLDGIPIKFTGRSPVLGNKGDLMLVQLDNYLIKDGSGPFVAASEHVEFKSNKTVIKIVWNVDGQTWNNEPLTLEDGSTQVSPFVVLE